MLISQSPQNSALFSLYLIRIFLFFSGLVITIYSLLGLFLFLSPSPLLPFFPIIFSLWRELFYNFFGLFWVQFRFLFFIDYVPFSLVLLLVGVFLIGFSFFSNLRSRYYFTILLVLLILEISFLPLGVFALYLLYNLVSVDHSQFQTISFQGNPFNDDFENKSALLLLVLLVLDFIIAFAFITIIHAITSTKDISLDPILIITIIFCAFFIIVPIGTIGLLFFKQKLFLKGSIHTGLASFIGFNIIVLSFYNLYPAIHSNIILLAPLSIFIIANALLDGYLLVTFKKINFEVFVFEN